MARRRIKEPRKTKAGLAKDQLDRIKGSVDALLTYTRLVRHQFEADKFIRLFWGDDTIKAVRKAQSVVDSSQFDGINPSIPCLVTLTHAAYLDPFEGALEFRLSQPRTGSSFLWPREMGEAALRPDHDQATWQAFKELLTTVAMEALDRATVNQACHFVIYECTHEQARYVFPPYLKLLRHTGLDELADSLETLKRAPPQPAIPAAMRQKIRWANQWFAMQELLGTWDGRHSASNDTDLGVTLRGITYIEQFTFMP